MKVNVPFHVNVFIFFREILRVELLDNMVVLFLIFLRKLCTVFRHCCCNLHSAVQEGFLFSTSLATLLIFLIIVFLTGVSWYLIVVLTCIFLMINDTEHLFICLWVISMSSLGKCLFRSSVHFLIGLLLFVLYLFAV